MINVKIFNLFLILLISINCAYADEDLDQIVAGDTVEDYLGAKAAPAEASPYIILNNHGNEVENQKIKSDAQPDFLFNKNTEVSEKTNKHNQYEEFGYTNPGTFEKSESYLEINKKEMAADFRKQSYGGLNITFVKNDFNYASDNDIINRTIGEGYKHVKGGALYIRNDRYFFKSNAFNSFWSVGAGLGYNSGRGIFVTGVRSQTTFKLWEMPIDAGIGAEVPIYHWFKISGAVGPSVTGLYQNRNDFANGEKGKNKMQVSYGEFANAQFKVNLSGFSDETAYDLFSSSKITNLFMNLELRYQNYANFQDNIKISGTSFGIGFTFEYL